MAVEHGNRCVTKELFALVLMYLHCGTIQSRELAQEASVKVSRRYPAINRKGL